MEIEDLSLKELKRRVLLLCLYAGRRTLVLAMILGVLILFGLFLDFVHHIHLVASLTAIATLVAYILGPAVNYLHRKKGINRILSITLVYFCLALLTVVAIGFIIPVIREQYLTFTKNLTHFLGDLQNNIKASIAQVSAALPASVRPMLDNIDPDSFSVEALSADLQNSLPKIVGGTFSGVFSGVKAAAGVMTGMILVPLFTFYILMDSDRYHNGFVRLVPRRWKGDALELMTEINNVLGSYIRGQLVVCFTVGASIAIVLNIIGLEYATLIGVFAGIIDIVPYVGVALGMIPAILIAWVNHGFLFVIFVVVVMEIVHWTEGHIIVPAVIGHSVGLPPLVVMVALGAGAELGGIMGMVLAIPLAAILRVLCLFYVRKMEQFEANEPLPNVHVPAGVADKV